MNTHAVDIQAGAAVDPFSVAVAAPALGLHNRRCHDQAIRRGTLGEVIR